MRFRLLLAALVLSASASADEWVVNPNPGPYEGVIAVGDGWRAARLPAMGSVQVDELTDAELPPVSVETKDGETILRSGEAEYVLGTEGLLAARLGGVATGVRSPAGATYEVTMEETTPLAARCRLKGKDGEATLTVFAGGTARLAVSGAFPLAGPKDGALWAYRPCTTQLGWVQTAGEGAYVSTGAGAVITQDLFSMAAFPGEASAAGPLGGEAILLVRPATPTAEVKVSIRHQAMNLKSKGAGALFELALRGGTEAAREWCVDGQLPFVLAPDGDTLAAKVPGVGRIVLHDRDGDGPDFSEDRWDVHQGDALAWNLTFSRSAGEGRLDQFEDLDKDGALSPEETKYPRTRLIDWDGDGRFFEGPVFFGGFLQRERLLLQDGVPDGVWDAEHRYYDLDGDGDWDILLRGGTIEMDYGDRDRGIPYVPRFAKPKGLSAFWGMMMHHAGARIWVSGKRDGAYFSYGENHISCKLKDQDPFPEAKYRTVAGANFFDWRATPSVLLARLTMGNLDAKPRTRTYDWDIQFSVNQEGQQQQDLGQGIHVENVQTYTDAFGHSLSLRHPTIPSSAWKGERLPFKKHPAGWGNVDSAPWKLLATWNYPYMNVGFAPENDEGEQANEGFHQWIVYRMMQRRWEVRLRPTGGETPLTLYYSPILGELQYKGADWGHRNGPAGHRDFKPRAGKDGTLLTTAYARSGGFYGDTHRFRLWGLQYLGFYDTDGDGYADLYHWDAENDGTPEMILRYDAAAGRLRVRAPGRLAEIPFRAAFEDVPYMLEDYDAICALYRKGLEYAPLWERIDFAENGMPRIDGEPVIGSRVLDAETLPRAAVDAFYAQSEAPWTDFLPGGLLRFGSLLRNKGFRLETLNAPWTTEALEGLDLLVLPGFATVPDAKAWSALEAWVRGGGRVLLLNAHESAESAVAAGTLLEPWGVSLASRSPVDLLAFVWRRPNYGTEGRLLTCAPANRIERFASFDPTLLEHFNYLSLRGRPLALGEGAKPLLRHGEDVLVALAEVGEGQALITDADAFTNRRLWHHSGVQTEARVDNLFLLERLVDRIMEGRAELAPALLQPAKKRDCWRPDPALPPGSTPEEGYEVLKTRHGTLELAVYPQLGGRLLRFGRPGGRNQLQTYPNKWSLDDLRRMEPTTPGQRPPAANYGGLADLAPKAFEGTPVWLRSYEARPVVKDKGIEVEHTEDGIRHFRRMFLVPGRSEMELTSLQTNVSDEDLVLNVRQNPCFAVGQSAGTEDVYIAPSKETKGAIQKSRHRIGGDELGVYLDHRPGWAALVDTDVGEAMLFRFTPEEYTIGFFWRGEIMSYDPVPLKPVMEMLPKSGFYTFELLSAPQRAAPGASMSRTIRWQLLEGLRDIDAVGPDHALDIAPVRTLLRPGETLACRVRAASAGAHGPLAGTLRLGGGEPVSFSLPANEAGESVEAEVKLTVPEGAGPVPLAVVLREGEETAVEGSVEVVIDAARLDRLARMLDDLDKAVAKAGAGAKTPSDRAELARLRLRRDRVAAVLADPTPETVDAALNAQKE